MSSAIPSRLIGQHHSAAYRVQVRCACQDLDLLRRRLRELERDIDGKLREHEVGRLLTTIDGIGPHTPPSRLPALGTQLLARAEGEASAKGCHGAYLDTFTFQSVEFYTRAGYKIFGTLEQSPNRHSRHFLRKPLHAA